MPPVIAVLAERYHPSKSAVEEPLEGEQARARSGLRYVGVSPLEWDGGPPGYQPGGLWFEKEVADPLDLRLRFFLGARWRVQPKLAGL